MSRLNDQFGRGLANFDPAGDAGFKTVPAEQADAADVTAETFLVAWRRYDDAPPGDGRPWLFGIARHVLANHHRSGRRRDRLGLRPAAGAVHRVQPADAHLRHRAPHVPRGLPAGRGGARVRRRVA